MKLFYIIFSIIIASCFIHCSSETNTAGILIETNTGNKSLIINNGDRGMARVLILVNELKISEGDTLQLIHSLRDSIGDTIFISTEYLEQIVDNADIVMEYVAIDSVPTMEYDSLIILPIKGNIRSIALNLDAKAGKTYRIGTQGVTAVHVQWIKDSYDAQYPADSIEKKIEHVFFDLKSFGLKDVNLITFHCKKEVFKADTLLVYNSSFGMGVDTLEIDYGIAAYPSYDSESNTTLHGGMLCDSIQIQSNMTHQSIPLHFKLGNCANYLIDSTGAKCVNTSNTEITEGNASAYFDLRGLDRKIGDTLKITTLKDRSFKNNTIYSTIGVIHHILDSIESLSGLVKLNDIPEVSEEHRWLVKLVNKGFFWSNFTLKNGETHFIYPSSYTKVFPVNLQIPKDFEDLISMDEKFLDMPLPIRLNKPPMNPCLVDIERDVIPLKKSESDSMLYWARPTQLLFSIHGTLQFDLLDSCYRSEEPMVELSRHTLSFDDELSKRSPDGVFGNALWIDSTDAWRWIESFEPFTNNGMQMSASIWIQADSVSQATQGNSYTRILSAKKDSVGFTLQQRNNQAAINLRLDARTDGKGVYNAIFGTARILDGKWHNYSFTIRGDSIYTYADGVIIEKSQFDNGLGFSGCTDPSIGNQNPNFVGALDEIFFFDGSQSENWMRLFYALQKQALK